jgi:hypothetical protein
VPFESVARAAGVSRSWLYTQPDIRAEVLRLRDLGRRASGMSVPARHRSSDASLLRRLQATTARNRELAQDNQRLRNQLAQALGQLRAAGICPGPGQGPNDQEKAAPLITINPVDHHHEPSADLSKTLSPTSPPKSEHP